MIKTACLKEMPSRFLNRITSRKDCHILPVTLDRKRIYILPTRFGLLFIIILAAMLAGSINYNNNLGFLLTFFLGSMMLVSLFHTHKNLKGIRIISVRTKPVFAGQNAVFEFLVRVSGYSRQAVLFGFEKSETIITDLSRQADNTVWVPVQTKNRGVIKPGVIRIKTCYPLGLFVSWSILDPEINGIVYPLPIPGFFHLTGEHAAGHENGKKEGPGVDDFYGLRAYQPGDPLQRVSWKTFSRGQGLYTKTFVGQFGTEVLFDWDSIKINDTEKKLSVLCHGILDACRRKMTYGLKLPGKTIPPGKGESHKSRCLKVLALFT